MDLCSCSISPERSCHVTLRQQHALIRWKLQNGKHNGPLVREKMFFKIYPRDYCTTVLKGGHTLIQTSPLSTVAFIYYSTVHTTGFNTTLFLYLLFAEMPVP